MFDTSYIHLLLRSGLEMFEMSLFMLLSGSDTHVL